MKRARVKEEHRNRFVLQTDAGDLSATAKGKLYLAQSLGESVVPKVGDYVMYEEIDSDQAVIVEVLPRGNSFVRLSAHDRVPQVIVANIDMGIVVQGLDGDFNIKRLERYLKLVEQSGARAVIVLNKCDLVEDVSEYTKKVEAISPDTPLYITSAKKGIGMDELAKIFKRGETAVFLGSSGSGKSTITNYLLQKDTQKTRSVREDDSRGRHTTTSRQLFTLQNGAFIIDTPGMRELSLLRDEIDTRVFQDIENKVNECRFRNCDHEKSEGCAIQEAIKCGEVEAEHFANYLKLKREREHEAEKVDVGSAREAKERAKQLAKTVKRVKEQKRFNQKM